METIRKTKARIHAVQKRKTTPTEQIAAAEGCRYQAVRDSVRFAIQKLKNFMSE